MSRISEARERRNFAEEQDASARYEELRLLDREELARRAGFNAPRQQLIAALINEAPTEAQEGSTMNAPSATEVAEVTGIPSAESLVDGLEGFEAASPDKAPYSRIRVAERTVAYASSRKDGILLDFAKTTVEGAPARFQKALSEAGSRRTMRVTAKNVKGARSLLEWIAKQQG